MIHVHRADSLVAPERVEQFRLEGEWSPRDLVREHRDPMWADTLPVAVVIGGRPVLPAEMDEALPPGSDVVIAPDIQWVQVLIQVALLLIQWGVQYALSRFDDPSRIELPDESSPTYLLDGITTSTGPGSPIPVVYGEHRCGGQLLASAGSETVTAPGGSGGQLEIEDWLHLLIAYSEGPIYRIGDVDTGYCGELDGLGYRDDSLFPGARRPNDLPEGLRVNGTAIEPDHRTTRAAAHLRTGTLHQSPMRGALRDSVTLYSVDDELTQGSPVVYETVEPIDALDIKLRFPAGLYRLDGSALKPYRVEFEIRMRLVGSGIPWAQAPSWRPSVVFPVGTRSALSKTIHWGDTWVRGRYQVRVERLTDDDNQSSASSPSSRCSWAFATEIVETPLSHPLLALLGLSLAGSERISGRVNSVTVPVKGRILSRWDGSAWLEEEWDDGAGKVTARNPSWVIADALTHKRYGAGRLIGRGQLDADSWQGLADYCDEKVDDGRGNLEARHQFDGVFDAKGGNIWDAVQRIARTCRAVVVPWGSEIRVVWDAPKPRSRLFTSASISDFRIAWKDTSGVPTIYEARIANRERDWEQDTIPQEDPDADLDPSSAGVATRRRKQVQLYGITRPSHARREMIYLFRRARYRDITYSWQVPLEGLGVEVFDRVAVEHFLPRWHAALNSPGILDDPDTFGYRTLAAASAGAPSITLDQQVTFAAGKTYQIIVRSVTGAPTAVLTITSAAGTYAAGATITFSGGDAETAWGEGAQVALGEAEKVVLDVIVTHVEILDGLVAQISGEKYDERVYDLPASYNPQGQESGDIVTVPGIGALGEVPDAEDISVQRTERPGEIELRWSWPSGYRDRAHCYLKTEITGWTLIADAEAPLVTATGLELGVRYDFAVALRDRSGVYQDPAEAAQISEILEEFESLPPPNIARISAAALDVGYVVEWAPVHHVGLDYYELRRGPKWHGAEVVARTRDTRIEIETAPGGFQSLWVRARGRNGLYSPRPVGGLLQASLPEGATLHALSIDFAGGGVLGTATGCSLNADNELELLAGEHTAQYDSAIIDAGTASRHWWSILCDQVLDEDWTVDELDFDVDNGEAHWRDIAGREASYVKPGCDFDWDVDGATQPVEQLTELVSGPVGLAAPHTRVLVDARFDVDGAGSWTAWRRFRAGYVQAQKMQARITLQRESDRYALRASALTLAVGS